VVKESLYIPTHNFRMAGESNTMALLSKKYSPNGKRDVLEKIFTFLKSEFSNKGDRYVMVDLHTDMAMDSMLTFRSQIFPKLWIDGSMQLMPILYKII